MLWIEVLMKLTGRKRSGCISDAFTLERGIQFVERLLNIAGDLDNVGAILCIDIDNDARLAIDQGGAEGRRFALAYIGHLAERHVGAVLAHQHCGRNLLRRHGLPLRAKNQPLISVLDESRSHHGGRFLRRRDHVVK